MPTLPSERAMITGLFEDRTSAERAYRAARELGYEDADINVLLSEDTRDRYFARGTDTPLSDKAAKSTEESTQLADELGGPAGGTVGTIAPALAAVGTLLLVPGLGILAAGPVAVALTAAGAVGITGGLIGALANWGVPKERLEHYESGIRAGSILFAVKPRSDEDARELVRRWKECGGKDVQS